GGTGSAAEPQRNPRPRTRLRPRVGGRDLRTRRGAELLERLLPRLRQEAPQRGRATCGRLKSDFRYSSSIVYNNFPWPDLPPPQPARSDGAADGRSSAHGPMAHAHASSPPASGGGSEGGKHRAAIEAAAQGVLDARAAFPDSTLADLYDPRTMPPALVKAHAALDRAVDAAYLAAEKAAGRKAPKLGTDAERVAFLFERYQQLVSLLPVEKPKRPARARA